MTIAVSAVIKPSRLLRAALAAYAVAGAGAAVGVAFGAGRFHFPYLIALACALGALAAWRAAARAVTMRVIDISGPGEIRLAVQQSMGSVAPQPGLLQLAPGSTVWPSLLMLLLRDPGGGGLTVLAILPDSVAPDQFRRIAVAIKAVAGRDNKFFGKNKIL